MHNPHPIAHWQDTACAKCPNLASCRSQVVVASPCVPGGLLAIGEAPGADEDIKGEGFIGTAGKTLDRLMAAEGVARAEYGRANICRCRPPENRKPTAAEVASCLPFLANLIQSCKPKVLLLVGGTATAHVMGAGALNARIEQSRISTFNDFSLAHDVLRKELAPLLASQGGLHCVPMPHTSPLAFNRNAPSGEKWAKVAERQVALAVSLLK